MFSFYIYIYTPKYGRHLFSVLCHITVQKLKKLHKKCMQFPNLWEGKNSRRKIK